MIRDYKKFAGKIIFTNAEMSIYCITKIRVDCQCRMCSAIIRRGCYCMGKNYTKYCIDCMPKVINNSIVSLNLIVDALNSIKNKIEEDKMEYTRNNLVCNL